MASEQIITTLLLLLGEAHNTHHSLGFYKYCTVNTGIVLFLKQEMQI